MTARLRRHMVHLADGRAVHLRSGGSGPPVLLCHESPRSSVALEALAGHLVDRFTVLAVDTAGYGLSDPLPLARPEIADYADGLVGLLDALGLQRLPVYGTHTGASIAVELARRHPDRVASAVLDGYPVFTAGERAGLLDSYLPPFRPDRHGGHVAWLWARVRDQFTVFPWNLWGAAARLPRDPPPLALHDQVAADILRAGDGYRTGYAAAFRHHGAAPVPHLTVPATFAARQDDLLFDQLDRLPDLPPGCAILRLGADRPAWGAALATALAGTTGDGTGPALGAEPAALATGPLRRHVLAPAGGDLMLHAGGPEDPAGTLLFLHDLPGAGRDWLPVLQALLPRYRVLAPDLPGCADSAPAAGGEPLAAAAATLAALLQAVPAAGPLTVVARGLAAPLALALADALPDRPRLLLCDPAPATGAEAERFAGYLPDLAPRWDGGHLTAAWMMLRDGLLYRPWCDRRRHAARFLGDELDTGGLHDRFVDLMQQPLGWQDLARAACGQPLAHATGHAGVRVLLGVDLPAAAGMREALRSAGCDVELADPMAWGDAIAAALADGAAPS